MRNTQMCSFRLGMLAAGLAVWVLLLDMSVSVLGVRVAVADTGSRPTPTVLTVLTLLTVLIGVPADRLPAVQKRIVLRTNEGTAVPGIEVQLAPADPTPGGPEGGAEVQKAVTGSDGTATFEELGRRIWMVTFSGKFEGKALQSHEEQGKAPYGRTRSGGGFPVMVQRQEEDAPPTPVVVQGTPQPEVQPSLFVLTSVGNIWIPTLDLALPGEHPQPLTEHETPTTRPTETRPTGIQTSQMPAPGSVTGQSSTNGVVPTREGEIDNFLRWLYVLPTAIGLIAVYRAWQERRQECRQESRQERQQQRRQHREERQHYRLLSDVPDTAYVPEDVR